MEIGTKKRPQGKTKNPATSVMLTQTKPSNQLGEANKTPV
jgi:hypothetical protein